jgi:hypothetical protein
MDTSLARQQSKVVPKSVEAGGSASSSAMLFDGVPNHALAQQSNSMLLLSALKLESTGPDLSDRAKVTRRRFGEAADSYHAISSSFSGEGKIL